ncbi:MAG: SpoIVB peptidase [Clostridia bacterium]|nr:SpoIVB peptidase [Clostridia bacterium]
MRKLGVFFLGMFLAAASFSAAAPSVANAYAQTAEVYIGGIPAGFTLSTGGAQVLGFCDVITESGKRSPASEAGLRAGDLIVAINGIKVETISEMNEILAKNGEKALKCKVLRGEESIEFSILPGKDKGSERYKIGVLIRDGVSGIGTVTYIDKQSGRFGALGHAVMGEKESPLSLTNGEMYLCSIVGVSRGLKGKAGELRGMFLAEKSLGQAEKLCTCGIYGKISDKFKTKDMPTAKATAANAKPGKASIYSTVSGEEPKEYSIEIVKVDLGQKDNKNFVVKITDEKLIEETGGIVQGMSGSPILQNGTLVGAITHVFVNDPTRGYGIAIEQMLSQ